MRTKKRRGQQHGSALLVTLMVMTGLSLLGLAFVAVTETESAISVNERNYAQTHLVAEAGSRLVLEWFQDPAWADANALLPPNSVNIKTERRVQFSGAAYQGYYRPTGLLCDRPFKGAAENRFFGDESHADININETNAATFLTNFNNAVLSDTNNGRVTEIKIYAPPIIDATLNANGFYEGGTRYGLATIKVTATKFANNRVIAQRWVKLVISEWPFPGPQGPVQSNANISTAGNFGVHWGRMTSERDMTIKRPLVGLPWYNAWESLHYEDGYYTENQNSNGVALPLAATGFRDQYNWLYALVGQGFDDPWYEARARLTITNATAAGLTGPQPYKYSAVNQSILNEPDFGYSNWFQNQDHDDGPSGDYKQVVFPKIDYEFWKNLSQSAAGTNTTVHYLKWVSSDQYTDGVQIKSFADWVNTAASTDPAKPGFYFFDSANGLNPQGAGAPGTLTPGVSINSSVAHDFVMKGFIYLNMQSFGTTGVNGPGGWFNYPGEPFRDIGYREVDTLTNNYTGNISNPRAGQFDYQELNGDGRLDIFVVQRTYEWPPASGTMHTGWFPVPWSPGCTPGFNFQVVGGVQANCSEPHEPFLNFIYPTAACCGGAGKPNPVIPGWQDPNNFTRRPIKTDASGNPIPCNTALNPPDPGCTSNGRDEAGALVQNFGNAPNTQPVLDGVLYNEGAFDTQGNAAYFGSILINGDILGTGTPEVWFDECLVRGCWQDKFKELPRVYVTAEETDQ